ncbi:MAG: hypothetical protein HOY78_04405 [Saccharothrix sp.]|nr:hypothetical protein [Saccharothrix sp.]
MAGVPLLLVVLGAAVGVVVLVLLWKLLVVAGLLGLGQWAVITQTDDPMVAVLVLGVPALITVFALSSLVPGRSGVLRHGLRRRKEVLVR